MPFTRAQAESLLNQREIGLFDDSRANALRKLDATAVQRRIERTREARDRARDLLQRQKLASRTRTGSKRGTSGQANQRTQRKAELLGDILARFREALPAARKRDRETTAATTKRAAPRKATRSAARATTPRTTTRGAAKRAATAKSAGKTKTKTKTESKPKRSAAAKRTSAKQATGSRRARAETALGGQGDRTASGKGTAGKLARRITPKRALSKTRKLLEAKQARDHDAPSWQALPGDRGDGVPPPGYQSAAAARKAQELHAGQSRMASIHGSISTRDRRNQGKRDHRSEGD